MPRSQTRLRQPQVFWVEPGAGLVQLPTPAPRGRCRLKTGQCSRRKANAYVRALHRHLPPPVGDKVRFQVWDPEGVVHGVAIVGRPTARNLDGGRSSLGRLVEITRVATDGQENACSALYGACARWARASGYDAVITYTLSSESGASLVAAGFELHAENVGGGHWPERFTSPFEDLLPSRPDPTHAQVAPKNRWIRRLEARHAS